MRAGPYMLYVIGIAFFCAMDATMKMLVSTMPAVSATLWRYIMAALFTLPFWFRAGMPVPTREMLPMHLLRACFVSVSAVLFFWGIGRLPLAQMVTIGFSAPLMIPPLAALFLKERLELRSLGAAVLGFAGVLLASGIGSGAAYDLPGVVAVALSAASYAVTVVIMRLRAAKDGPALVSLLGAAIPALMILPFALWAAPGQVAPVGKAWIWAFGAGIFGAIALQMLARAYAQEQAQRLAPFEYTALAWAALFGWLFFAEPVEWRTLAGAAVIALACLWQMGLFPFRTARR